MDIISLKDFLKKYSTLNNEFIDDFYLIYDFNEYNNDDFIINIVIVAKWLGSRKSTIKDTLTNTYSKNIDYKTSKEIPTAKISKSNKEIILLTPDCFKRLCLLSKTAKGEEVRTYFIELEKLINNYKNYIINGLKKTVSILENNQKPIPSNIKSTVYILRSLKDIDGIYRFGQTDDFKRRLYNYNSANSDKMKVMLIYETKNAKRIEDCVISQIKDLRYKKRKDFYEINIKLLKKITKDCIELTLKYKNPINKKQKENAENLYLYIQK